MSIKKPPTPTENWSNDCAAGREYARFVLEETDKFQDPLALLAAVAIMKGSPLSGIQVGFYQTIAETLLVLSDANE